MAIISIRTATTRMSMATEMTVAMMVVVATVGQSGFNAAVNSYIVENYTHCDWYIHIKGHKINYGSYSTKTFTGLLHKSNE